METTTWPWRKVRCVLVVASCHERVTNVRLLLTVGLEESAASQAFHLISSAGQARLHAMPAAPSRSDLDPLLDALNGATLVVAADDTGLNAVVTRLLRRGLSADVPVAVLPTAGSVAARRLGLPTEPEAAAAVALTGIPTLRGLVRDDHGGVLLAGATLTAWRGTRFGARAHLDETEIANGMVRGLAVRPDAGCLRASVAAGPLRRLVMRSRSSGRAVTVSCEQARLVADGVPHPRPQTRRTWWYQPDLWRVVLPR